MSSPESSAHPLVLVTGCAGRVGVALAKGVADTYRIVGLDIRPPEPGAPYDDFVECDLTDMDKTRSALREVRERHGPRVAGVAHLAAYSDFSGEPSPLYEEVTVKGSERLLEALDCFEAVEQFMFTSSLLVMHPVEEGEGPLREDSATEATWEYPRSKLKAEETLKERHGDIPLVLLRIADVYDEACHSIQLGQHIRRIYEKDLESHVFPGDKGHGQPFLHLEDLVSCIRTTLEARARLEGQELFLISEPRVLSHQELQDRIGTLIYGGEWTTLRVPKPVAKAGAWVRDKLPWEDPFIKPYMVDIADDHYPVEIQRAREKLHWEPEYRLYDVLEEMIAFLSQDPIAFYQANNLEWTGKAARAAEGESLAGDD